MPYCSPSCVARRLGLLFCVGIALGCSETDETQNLGSNEDNVIGGEATLDHPEVGLLRIGTTSGGSYSCTATLLSPSAVIAAGHCVRAPEAFNDKEKAATVREVPQGRSADFIITTPDSKKHTYAIDKYIPFDAVQSAYAHIDDISVLHLSTPVELEEVKVSPLSCSLPGASEDLVVFGYGCTQIGAKDWFTKRKRTISSAKASVDDASGIVFPAKCNVGASNTVTQPGLLCPVDSGGPVFNAAGEIVGINSGGNGKCSVLAPVQPKYVAALRALASESWGEIAPSPGWQTLQQLETVWTSKTAEPQDLTELSDRVKSAYASAATLTTPKETLSGYEPIANWYRKALVTDNPGALLFDSLLCQQPTASWQAHWQAGEVVGDDTLAVLSEGEETGKVVYHYSAVHWMKQ